MSNIDDRLAQIFMTAFPDLPESAVRSATQQNTPNWDSVAAITLMNLIEEEFQIQMDFEDLADLTSFAKISEYLSRKYVQVGG